MKKELNFTTRIKVKKLYCVSKLKENNKIEHEINGPIFISDEFLVRANNEIEGEMVKLPSL